MEHECKRKMKLTQQGQTMRGLIISEATQSNQVRGASNPLKTAQGTDHGGKSTN